MAELVQENWILLVIALVVAVLVAWWIFAATRRTRVDIQPSDEADGQPARRNQALIDAPPAAATGTIPPPTPIGMAGIGEAVAAATITAPPMSEPEPSPLPLAPLPLDPSPLDPAQLDPEPQPEQSVVPAAPAPQPPQPAATPEAAPAPAQAPAAATTASEELVRIKGLGPRLADQLQALGVTSLAQIAAWDDAEIDRIDAQLGRFQGRIRRDNWPEQAQLLTAGDVSAYEARFGKL